MRHRDRLCVVTTETRNPASDDASLDSMVHGSLSWPAFTKAERLGTVPADFTTSCADEDAADG